MTIFDKIADLFLSPRFVSFYWQAGSVALIGLLSLIAENLANLGLPEWAVVFVGLVLAQLTKALSNASKGKELGFSRQN